MKETDKEVKGSKKVTEVRTYPVPFTFESVSEVINIRTNDTEKSCISNISLACPCI